MTTTHLQPRSPGIRGVLREVRSVPRVVAAAAVSGLNTVDPLSDVGPIVVIPGWAPTIASWHH
ncbi:MAG: hypothetical protein GEU79_00180 [Acidimicrobiia bacterium]|nr:hypothetical protein [Acidimicrobiia bacterium]